jgi:hypothetical protein
MKWHNYSRSEKVKSIRRGTYLASKVLGVKVYLEEADNDKILNALNEISKIIKSEKILNVINKP